MCVSMFPADFHGTTVCISEAVDPATSAYVHVLIYQNTALNLFSDGANAMVLHFPSRIPMSRDNVIETKGFSGFLDDIRHAAEPPMRSALRSKGLDLDLSYRVEVFDTGIYTVVLAENSAAIPGALGRVREDRRPAINTELFRWYGEMFPNYSVALCCFNNNEAVDADPMMWFYEPRLEDTFMLPAVDCHTGATPDLQALVEVDHHVILGSKQRKHEHMGKVHYKDEIPEHARVLLPDFVIGRKYRGRDTNADFVAPVAALGNGFGGARHIERRFLTA